MTFLPGKVPAHISQTNKRDLWGAVRVAGLLDRHVYDRTTGDRFPLFVRLGKNSDDAPAKCLFPPDRYRALRDQSWKAYMCATNPQFREYSAATHPPSGRGWRCP